jgi:hypothetical protein
MARELERGLTAREWFVTGQVFIFFFFSFQQNVAKELERGLDAREWFVTGQVFAFLVFFLIKILCV